jgi:hypothetical protein
MQRDIFEIEVELHLRIMYSRLKAAPTGLRESEGITSQWLVMLKLRAGGFNGGKAGVLRFRYMNL